MPKSTAATITASLEKGKISPVYLLTGEDLFRKREVIQKITAALHPARGLGIHIQQASPAHAANNSNISIFIVQIY